MLLSLMLPVVELAVASEKDMSEQDASEHELILSLRARAARVDIAEDTARAQSLRVHAGVSSAWGRGLASVFEVEHVETFSDAEHSDWVRFNGQPIIPDVGGTEINQLFIRYQPSHWQLGLGRMRIALDDQRFVGSDGFWQNDQTFDAAMAQLKLMSASRLQYFYIDNANRIFGDDADDSLSPGDTVYERFDGQRPARLLGDHGHNTHLLQLELNEWDHVSLLGYLYLMDNRDDDAASNRTLGAKYSYQRKYRGIKYRAVAALALQELDELPNKPRPVYNLLEFAAGIPHWRILLRRESLGADEGKGFITPLGSQHDFNGWADLFWFTPDQGVNDYSLQLRWRAKPWELDLRLHEFHQDTGGDRYGRELDLGASYKLGRDHSVNFTFARFVSSQAYQGRLADRSKFYLDYTVAF